MAICVVDAPVDELASRPGRDTLATNAIKTLFIAVSLLFLAALLFAPLATVFLAAFEKGFPAFLRASDYRVGVALAVTPERV